MPDVTTADGRYRFVEQSDGNVVVYDRGRAVWDRWSWEATSRNPTPADPPVLPPPAIGDPGPTPPPAPLPSGPRLIRVTTEPDGLIAPRTYSYWPNAWIGPRGIIYVFCGAGGRGQFFQIDPDTGAVDREGPLLGTAATETEGWYWDAEGWVYFIVGPRLYHANPFTGDAQIVVDISEAHPGCVLWQAHSADDGQTHSATVKRIVPEGPYPAIGTLLVQGSQQTFFPAQGDLDESQITPDGGWLLIKEDENNRIITVGTRETRVIADADGAVGHSDCGPGFMVGEDNIHGQCVRWDLVVPLVPERRRGLFPTWGMGHLSIRGGRGLLSDATALSLLDLETGARQHLLDHGMVGQGYDYQVKANLDPTGQVACFLTNNGGPRQDLYLLRV